MELVVTILVGLLIIGLLVWGISLLTMLPTIIVQLMQAVVVIGGAIAIAHRAGLF